MSKKTESFIAAGIQNSAEFITEAEILRRIPICRRTLLNWRQAGKLPFVNLGGRRILFHWDSVTAALLRHQHGGANE